jgi:hypothetical protein
VDQHDVARFERGFHAVEGQPEAIVIGRPHVPQNWKKLHLLLGLGGWTSRDRAVQRQMADLERLRIVVGGSGADQDGFG